MKKLVLFVVSLFLMGAANVALGQRTVTGKVTSADEPMGIPMVAVQVEGTTIGTSTDLNGVYTLNNIPATAKNLKFSAMGMKDKIVPITSGVPYQSITPGQFEELMGKIRSVAACVGREV